jgi:Ca2+-binding RTX toxin-like protein
MGSISLTAVNAFGDQGAARQASAHLVDRGYPVVSASRLDEISVRNGLLAIVGAGHDHERMIAISAQLHDRIAALAVVGGPLAILLGRHEGLTMPTLVVSDRVGRRERRSAVRRLPRGSMLVRAANFDAALDAVVAFLDRTTESVPQRVGSRNLRPLALGLASAAFFAPAAAVLVAGGGADAAAAAVCTPADQGGGLLSITCDGEGGARLTLIATDDGVIKLNDEQVALLSETQKISILTTGGDDQLTIDESLRKFTTGPESTPIAFDVDMGAGQDELKWMGSPDNDSFKLTADAIDVPGGEEFENKALGVELLNFDLGDGDDTFDGGSWALKIELDGGRGKDSLIGGLGEDVFKLSPGGDFLDGNEGFDLVKVATDESLLKITAETIELADSENIVEYKEMEALQYLGGAAESKIEINGFHFDKFDFDGGGGLDELKLTTGLPAVQLSGDKISLLDADQKLVGEIKYTDFDTFSYLGDALAAKIGLDDTVRFAKLDLDGGGGGDNIKLTSGDSLIGITDTAISLNFAKIEIDYKEFSELNLIGGAADSKIEIHDFTGFAKLSLDGGGGLDDIKLSTGESLLKITETELAPGDLNRNPIEHTGIESLSVLAATDIANTFDGSKVKTLKLTLDGGSKDDILFGGALDDLLIGGLGNNKISGGGGFDTLAEAVDANFVASNSTLAGAGLDAFSSIEALKLTGGAGDNYLNTEPFKGKVTLDGGAGNDLLISGQSTDLLTGGLGNDSLFAGQGNDTLLAGEGDDTLNGGPGNDFGDGGPGIDTGKSIEQSVNIER